MPRPSRFALVPTASLALLCGGAAASPDVAPAGSGAPACPADCAMACCVDLNERVAFEQPELWVGDKAPALTVAQFVKGESVHGFEPGRVYVVEFWATWCGPCIRAMPHVTQLQKQHADTVTILGVNIWDTKPGETQQARLQRVGEWVAKNTDRMGYTVAVSAVEGESEAMSEQWMRAAGRDGIPSAFIVDAKGRIAWMGNPTSLDEPLARVAAGTHEYAELARGVRDEQVMMSAFMAFAQDIHSEDSAKADEAYTLGRALACQHFKGKAEELNALAWTAIDHEAASERCVKFGLSLAEEAAALSGWKDPMILDTLAVAAFKSGDRARAIEVQTKAIGLLSEDDRNRESYVKQLEMFKAAG